MRTRSFVLQGRSVVIFQLQTPNHRKPAEQWR
jgi:hypothetical protein